jgi:rhodanese-related sulfurtransferase
MLDWLDELPGGRLWVHCASGYRASIAACLLDRAGLEVVLIDDDPVHAAPILEGYAAELPVAPAEHRTGSSAAHRGRAR